MDLRPIPIAAGICASERCIVRGERLVQVKFVALPMDAYARAGQRGEGRGPISTLFSLIIRAIGRLVAARP